MKIKRSFTDEFRRDAVRRAIQPGAVVSHVAEELDIRSGMLARWVREDRARGRLPDDGAQKALPPPNSHRTSSAPDKRDAEIDRLKEQVAKLTRERDALKKTLAVYLSDD